MNVMVSGTGSMCRGHVSCGEATSPWFDAATHLGLRGHKYLTEPTKYLLAATRYALESSGLSEPAESYGEEHGVIVGTNWAVRKILEQMDDTILQGGANDLQPMWAPNFSVNIPASQVSLKHRFRAFNLTLTTPDIAGLQALELAAQAISRGRASTVVVGATDGEASPDKTDAEPGACVVVLEARQAVTRREHHGCSAGLAATYSGCSFDAANDERIVLSMIREILGEAASVRWCGIAGRGPRAQEISQALSHHLHQRLDEVEISSPICAPERFMTAAPLLAIAEHGRIDGPLLVTQVGDRGHLAGVLLVPSGEADR